VAPVSEHCEKLLLSGLFSNVSYPGSCGSAIIVGLLILGMPNKLAPKFNYDTVFESLEDLLAVSDRPSKYSQPVGHKEQNWFKTILRIHLKSKKRFFRNNVILLQGIRSRVRAVWTPTSMLSNWAVAVSNVCIFYYLTSV
jgi:hypothetical protein